MSHTLLDYIEFVWYMKHVDYDDYVPIRIRPGGPWSGCSRSMRGSPRRSGGCSIEWGWRRSARGGAVTGGDANGMASVPVHHHIDPAQHEIHLCLCQLSDPAGEIASVQHHDLRDVCR